LSQSVSIPYIADSSFYFERIRHLGDAVWLDSGRPANEYGRYDILAAGPNAVLSLHQGKLIVQSGDTSEELSGCPFSAMESLLKGYPKVANSTLPFNGGLIGHFSYDLGRAIEDLPTDSVQDIDLPELQAGLYHWALIQDHQEQLSYLVHLPDVDPQSLISLLDDTPKQLDTGFNLTSNFEPDISPEQYAGAFDKIEHYINAGDCYQVNYAQRFSAQYQGDPWQAYKQLRSAAPTQFAAYLESGGNAILSLSPERFLEVSGDTVTTKPIKGTRPRGSDSAQDLALYNELKESKKDRAENLMIVDLLRNDLSKACEFGSVKVPKLFDIESYANVHHLVTTITGKLDHQHPASLLRHCFPGGSITGAPKIRAMEIIDELEPTRRSIYCGSIGYISLCGRMDTSITIRTLLCQIDRIYCWAGGGIVADSTCDSEYQETFSKVNNLLDTLNHTLITEK